MAMDRWLFAVALIFSPALALAQSAPSPAPTPAIDAPVDLLLDLKAPLKTAPAPQTHAAQAPAGHGYIPEGWGLRATFHGRAMDVSSRDWSDDPHAQPRDIEAGWGWRDGRATALIGYESHDYGPKPQQTVARVARDPNQPAAISSPGVLGFSLVLHGR